MNKFNQTVLMAALVSSAANAANVDIDGNATLGLMYTVKATQGDRDHQFSVESGIADPNGMAALNFSSHVDGKNHDKYYYFLGTLTDFDGSNAGLNGSSTSVNPEFNLMLNEAYVGYANRNYDVRAGQLDSLTYTWVGSLNGNGWKYNEPMAVRPEWQVRNTNVLRFTTQQGPVQLGIQSVMNRANSYDYAYIELGAKAKLAGLDISLVHQDVNDATSTNAYAYRNTNAVGLEYSLGQPSKQSVLGGLTLMGTYADYSDQTTANATGQKSEENSYSIGLKTDHTAVLYQTSIEHDRARWNVMHTKPINEHITLGMEAQFGSKNYYGITDNATDNTTTREKEWVVGYVTYML
ncbi:MAG: hypothetical protein VX835_02075 [Pseudomonadota bacterium]|nr:hypothetical protein [Pseudomonadota bacterium]